MPNAISAGVIVVMPLRRLQRLLFLPVFIITSLLWPQAYLAAQQPKTRVTLGIKPDYWSTQGVRLKGVVKGTAADRARLQKDDVIVAFDKKAIKNIFTYRDLLSEYKAGDTVVLKVKRAGKLVLVGARFE